MNKKLFYDKQVVSHIDVVTLASNVKKYYLLENLSNDMLIDFTVTGNQTANVKSYDFSDVTSGSILIGFNRVVGSKDFIIGKKDVTVTDLGDVRAYKSLTSDKKIESSIDNVETYLPKGKNLLFEIENTGSQEGDFNVEFLVGIIEGSK